MPRLRPQHVYFETRNCESFCHARGYDCAEIQLLRPKQTVVVQMNDRRADLLVTCNPDQTYTVQAGADILSPDGISQFVHPRIKNVVEEFLKTNRLKNGELDYKMAAALIDRVAEVAKLMNNENGVAPVLSSIGERPKTERGFLTYRYADIFRALAENRLEALEWSSHIALGQSILVKMPDPSLDFVIARSAPFGVPEYHIFAAGALKDKSGNFLCPSNSRQPELVKEFEEELEFNMRLFSMFYKKPIRPLPTVPANDDPEIEKTILLKPDINNDRSVGLQDTCPIIDWLNAFDETLPKVTYNGLPRPVPTASIHKF